MAVIDANPTQLWHELLRDAESRSGAMLDEDTESYLVFLLMRHLRDAGLGGRVLALDSLLALAAQGAQRRDALRDVGDRCLLIAGWYPAQAEQRLVSLDYFLTLGAHAYAELAHATRSAWSELYTRLAQAFARLVRVLVALRRLAGEGPSALSRHALALADPAAAAHEFPDLVLLHGDARRH